MYFAIGGVVLLNFAMLLAYQHYLAADFPFQDEIGYVNRLHHLPQLGLFHYLFDPYWNYVMPTQLGIWYAFYAQAHLNIMAIRYTGAIVSALSSLLLCMMLYRSATRVHLVTLLVILCAPFMVCSYNNWASYNQSIESIVEPLLFGLVLLLTWLAEKIRRAFEEHAPIGQTLAWICGFIVTWLLATGISLPPLVLVAAIVGARILLERRIDLTSVLLGIVAVLVPAAYVLSQGALNQGMSAMHSAFGIREFFDALKTVVGLVGNSVFTPGATSHENITLALGTGMLLLQFAAIAYVLRLPADQRSRFTTPLTLTLFSVLVLLEIVGARLHEPGVAFTPRYSWFGLYAPVSLLFWVVALSESIRWQQVLGVGILIFGGIGVALADTQTAHQLPYTRVALQRDRATLMSLRAAPTAQQQALMFVNPPLLDFVYPDLQFLQQEHLAMYEGAQTGPALPDLPFAIVGSGPGTIKAKTPFGFQRNGLSSVWIKTNASITGEAFVVLNGEKLQSFHHDDIVTALVPPSLYSRPGTYPLYVIEGAGKNETRSNTVSFVVH